MTNSGANNGSNKGKTLTGNTILDKLLNQLSQDDREFVLRLMTELGIRADDPMHPLLVALQYYICLLRDIPEQMRVAAKDSMREALTTYGTIQTEIDNSVDRVKVQVDRVDEIRERWKQDAKALLPEFKTSFDAGRKVSLEAHQAEMRKNAEAYLQDWMQELKHIHTFYLKDVRHQGFLQSLGIGAVALVLCSGLSGWVGWQMHQKHWEQRFGSAAKFDWFTNLWFTKDNQQRFQQCYDTQDRRSGEDRDKCTIWYQ